MSDLTTRIEHDTMGEVAVPVDALYGAQTARAVVNFQISGWRMPDRFIRAMALIKKAFAQAHGELGLIPDAVSEAIAAAAGRIWESEFLDQFPVDVFQTGSGTSTNMNVNEVIAHVAERALGERFREGFHVHPNDHVNRGQSSNDVVPSALRLAAILGWREELAPQAGRVLAELRRLAAEHRGTVTLGRTHLMDAVPTTYGRVFAAWAQRLDETLRRVDGAAGKLQGLPLGGTAVGSGIGSAAGAVARVTALLAHATGIPVTQLEPPAAGIAGQDAPIEFADALAGLGRVLFAIANDIRLRSSGPSGGLGELVVPAVQPGSSNMPGKVNPVIPEAVVQVAIEVEGLAAGCRATAALHQLDLSHANPLLAWNLDTMTRLLGSACSVFAERCLSGLQVDVARARELAARSPAVATALANVIGYERAAVVAKAAGEARESVGAAAGRLGVLESDQIEALLDLETLAGVEET